MAKVKRAAADKPVPQTIEEADDFVRRIGEAQHRLGMIEAGLTSTIAAAKRAAEEEAKPLAQQVEDLILGLSMWAAANRNDLTQGGKTKTAKLPSGEIAWRSNPPSVALKDVESIVATLLASPDLARFLRTKHEVNKDALLAEPQVAQQITGVTVRAGVEQFVVTPTKAELATQAEARVAA